MKKITITDIAARAGVSIATVSRVMNDQDNVSLKTKTHVIETMAAMNLEIPEKIKSGLPLKLGMVVSGYDSASPESSFFYEVVSGAGFEADRRHATFSFTPILGGSPFESELLKRGDLDGLIVAGVPIPDNVIKKISAYPFPTVFIGRYLEYEERLNYVTPDNVGGGRIAAKYLYESGHREICILNGSERLNVFRDRILGVQEILSQPSEISIMTRNSFNEEAGYEAMAEVLERKKRPTAVLALSDWMAIGALRAIRDEGLCVPDDISVMGFSDLPVTGIQSPPLTTIHIPQWRLGTLAVQLLISLIQKNLMGPVGMVVPLELVVRGSTRPLGARP